MFSLKVMPQTSSLAIHTNMPDQTELISALFSISSLFCRRITGHICIFTATPVEYDNCDGEYNSPFVHNQDMKIKQFLIMRSPLVRPGGQSREEIPAWLWIPWKQLSCLWPCSKALHNSLIFICKNIFWKRYKQLLPSIPLMYGRLRFALVPTGSVSSSLPNQCWFCFIDRKISYRLVPKPLQGKRNMTALMTVLPAFPKWLISRS